MDAGNEALASEQQEEQRLHSLGYEQELKREFSFWHAAALGFADISPIVALYGMFGLALAAAGPPFFWGLFLVLAGQLLVAMVFGEIASRWPLAGGVYQWTRQQVGTGVAWFAGWAYMWTLTIAMSTVAFAAATFTAAVFGWEADKTQLVLLAFAFLAFGTLANTVGQWVLKVFVSLSIMAEFIASLIVGVVLLLFYQVNPIDILFDTYGAAGGATGMEYLLYAWLGAVAFIGWSFLGFEASGAIAEEVRNPARAVPWSIIVVLGFVGAVVIFTSLAILLAMPDIQAAMTGDIADPVAQTMEYHFGPEITKPLLALIALGFTASMVALQTAVSRTVFSFARDKAIPFHDFFQQLSGGHKLPTRAIVFTGVLAAIFLAINLGAEQVYTLLLSFVVGGFYISFLFPVAAALYLHVKKRHEAGPFSLRRFSFVVTLMATIWLVFELVNIAWPRYPELEWYENWGVILIVIILGILGAIAYAIVPEKGTGEEI
jgi:amino acid transporter